MQTLTNLLPARRRFNFSALLDSWLDDARPRLKAGSYSTYAGIVEGHLRPTLGSLPLRRLDEERLRTFWEEVRTRCAPATAQILSCVLRQVLNHGTALGYPLPQLDPEPRPNRGAARILSEPEICRLESALAAAPGLTELGVLLCLHTGLRLGELCALTWRDLDGQAGAITIRRTLLRIRSDRPEGPRTQLVFSEPKSVGSHRTIPIPPADASRLEQFRASPDDFLLTGTDRPMDPRTMQNRFKNLLRRAGVDDINFHALRHTFATRCVDCGCDPKTLSTILGHADVSMTLNRYVHPSLSGMRACMGRAFGEL